MCVEFVVDSRLAPKVSPGSLVSPPPKKLTFSNSNSDRIEAPHENQADVAFPLNVVFYFM